MVIIMANIFRSKEIYKKTVNQDNENKIYEIRGLYVVGDYSPATYKNPLTCIVDILSNKANVVDFTIKNEELQSDHVLNIVNFDMDPDDSPAIVRYSVKQEQVEDHVLNIVDFDMDPDTTPEILKYTKSSSDIGDDHVLNIVNFDMDPPDIPTFVKYFTKIYPHTHQPCIRITSIKTTRASCVDRT